MAKTVEAPVTEAQDKQKPAVKSRAPRKAKASLTRSKKAGARQARSQARPTAQRKKSAKRGPGKRYSAAEKKKIMAAAKKSNMTGAEAAKKFGISTLTFYRWRGPVRGRKAAKRGPGRPPGAGKVKINAAEVRRAVQEQIRKMLPRIIREEVAAALGD